MLISDIEILFEEINEEINEDYYKPIKTKSTFDDNHVEYEIKGGKHKNLYITDYLDIIKPFLKEMINNDKARGEWEIQLTMQINFISSLDTGEIHTMYSKSINVKIMKGYETDDIINEIFEPFFKKYHEGLETKMRGSDFVFESVDSLKYHLHRISMKTSKS